jgi:formylglycine-generating enzyme required for sulfatase activity
MRAGGAAAMVVAAAVAVASITPLAAGVFEPVSDFVEIPAGAFTMGADRARDPDAFENERWPTTAGAGIVDLPAFFIARHETTVAEFGEFVRATRWPVDARALAAPPTHPVTFVSWPDALAYCRWLESHLKKPGWRVTLPTEAEWEKAARGTDGRRFPWGNDERNGRANYLAGGSASTSKGTTPVGFFQCPDCAHGLADMSGNVWEWTGSPYQPYPYDERDDRVNLDADALWTIRGGHFGDPARMVRTTVRTGADPGARRAFIGFRVALRRR